MKQPNTHIRQEQPDHVGEDSSTTVQRVLEFDVLATAEQVAGGKGQADEKDVIAVARVSSQIKKEILSRNNDTYFAAPREYLLERYTEQGFEVVYTEEFARIPYGNEPPVNEEFIIWAHRDGMILIDCTCSYYIGTDLIRRFNGGKLYYNWQPNDEKYNTKEFNLGSGGYIVDPIKHEANKKYNQRLRDDGVKWSDPLWNEPPHESILAMPMTRVGYIDTREGMIHNLKGMRKYGSFLPVWIERPHMYLLEYEEWRNYSSMKHEAFTAWANQKSEERRLKLPDWVQEMMGSFT